MRKKINENIRNAINNSGLMMHEVAESLGVSELTFYRWLRYELSDEKKQEILVAIEKIKKQSNVFELTKRHNADPLNLTPKQWESLTMLMSEWANLGNDVPFHQWLLDEKK